MSFELVVLGSNSAIPCHGRHPSAQVLHIENHKFLIDCGEGTQMQMDRYNIRKFKISKIFISHMHGDHVFGLPGLLTTMNLLGRKDDIDVYGPVGIRTYIEAVMNCAGVTLSYPLNIHEHSSESLTKLFENDEILIQAFPLDHRVPTNGYLFTKKPTPRHLDGEAAERLNVPFEWRNRLRRGEDYISEEGNVIRSSDITTPGDPAVSFAYCSDTKYKPQLSQWLQGVDCMYHEATFTSDLEERAAERYHSTGRQAGLLAASSRAGQLLIGHLSSRYTDFNEMLDEARSVFPNTEAAEEGRRFVIQSKK